MNDIIIELTLTVTNMCYCIVLYYYVVALNYGLAVQVITQVKLGMGEVGFSKSKWILSSVLF